MVVIELIVGNYRHKMPVWGLSINEQWYIFKSIRETLIRKIVSSLLSLLTSVSYLSVWNGRLFSLLTAAVVSGLVHTVFLCYRSQNISFCQSRQKLMTKSLNMYRNVCEQKKREGEHGDRPSVSRLTYSSVMQMKAVLEHWFIMHMFSQCIDEKKPYWLIVWSVYRWSQFRTTTCALKQPAHLKLCQTYFCLGAFGSRFWEQIRIKFWHRFAHGSKPNHQIHHHSSLRSLPVISMVCPTEAGSQLEHDITMAMLLADSLRATLLWDRLMLASAPHLHTCGIQSNGPLVN